jgi:hypothetical protein
MTTPSEKTRTREEKKRDRLVKELFALETGLPLIARSDRPARVEKPGALSEDAVDSRDAGTRLLKRMLPNALLREDDQQCLYKPLIGLAGRTLVEKCHDSTMLAPGTWTDHEQVFTKDGVCSGPSKKHKRMETSSAETSDLEATNAEASDSEEKDTWVQCEACNKWRRMGVECQLEQHETFVCTDVPNHTCETPEEPCDEVD